MSVSQALELAVVSGHQKGARAVVEPNNPVNIGSHSGSDIVINDSQAQGDNISLTIVGKAAKVTVNSGSIYCRGKSIEKGSMATIGMYDRIKIGDTELAYGEADSPYWQFNKVTYWHKACQIFHNNKYKLLELLVILLVVGATYLIISNTALIVTESNNEQQFIEDISQLKTTLTEHKFANIEVNSDKKPIIISGYLKNRTQYRQVLTLLEGSGIAYKEQLLIESVLAEQVSAIFRLHGYSVEVEVDNGTANITSDHSDKSALLSVKSVVLADIPSLSVVNIKHRLSPTFFNKSGKTIVMAVQGNKGYVLTHDGTKYYLGSTLADGYVISDITDRTVKLTLDNTVIEHAF